MNVLTSILIAVLALSLAAPATTMGQAWETDDYGFLIEPAPTRTRRTQQRRSNRVQPQRVVVGQPLYRVMPTQPSLNVVASADSGTAYRSFSYAPTVMAKGGEVEAVGKVNQLRRGREVLGRVEGGQMLTVLDECGPWVGGNATIDDKQHNGWIWHADLRTAKATEIAPAVSAAPQAYRSFSYEPAAIESRPAQPMIIASGTAAVRSTRAAVRSRRKPTYLRPGAKSRGEFGHGGR